MISIRGKRAPKLHAQSVHFTGKLATIRPALMESGDTISVGDKQQRVTRGTDLVLDIHVPDAGNIYEGRTLLWRFRARRRCAEYFVKPSRNHFMFSRLHGDWAEQE